MVVDLACFFPTRPIGHRSLQTCVADTKLECKECLPDGRNRTRRLTGALAVLFLLREMGALHPAMSGVTPNSTLIRYRSVHSRTRSFLPAEDASRGGHPATARKWALLAAAFSVLSVSTYVCIPGGVCPHGESLAPWAFCRRTSSTARVLASQECSVLQKRKIVFFSMVRAGSLFEGKPRVLKNPTQICCL